MHASRETRQISLTVKMAHIESVLQSYHLVRKGNRYLREEK